MEKVNNLREAGIITAEEFASISGPPRTEYALIGKITPKEQAGHE